MLSPDAFILSLSVNREFRCFRFIKTWNTNRLLLPIPHVKVEQGYRTSRMSGYFLPYLLNVRICRALGHSGCHVTFRFGDGSCVNHERTFHELLSCNIAILVIDVDHYWCE